MAVRDRHTETVTVIERAKGDLFAAGLPALAHGVNCMGAASSGLTREFWRRWPAMHRLWRARCREGHLLPGDVFAWAGQPRVYNLATQMRPGAVVPLGAVEVAVARMLALAEAAEVAAVGMPRLGCGAGGLRWVEVSGLLDDLASASPVQLIVFEEA